MIAFIVRLASTKIGRGVIGAVIIGFFILTVIGGFKLWLASHDKALLSSYVLRSEKVAAEATAQEMERQRNAAQQATEEHRRRLEAAQAEQAKNEATLETEIRSYELLLSEKNRQCLVDDADREWLLRH
ncbi:hypothetical protein AB3480_00370 [Rhizobium mongolense]|uniref:hypothetical protein n=1 Tax=Rhizobium mongolense TaxID=57676 RepID=UPI0034A329B9